VDIVWYSDHVCYLLQQAFDLLTVFVSSATVEDEAYSLETLDSAFVLIVFTAKVAAWKSHLSQILCKGLIVFVHADDPVDNLWPIVERVSVADEKVVLVEDGKHFGFERLNEEDPSPVKDVIEDLRRTFCIKHIVGVLILDDLKDNIQPFTCSNDNPVHLLGQISVLQYLQP
jgi:hypothetical protein